MLLIFDLIMFLISCLFYFIFNILFRFEIIFNIFNLGNHDNPQKPLLRFAMLTEQTVTLAVKLTLYVR